MSTFNPLPYSNQFERGHSFHWAGAWKPNTHYLNDEYVTDFVVHKSCILACRVNHLSSEEPEIIIDGNKALDVKSPYWLFVVDCVKDNPAEINSMQYDEQTGDLTIKYIDGRSDVFKLNFKISDSTIHIGRTPPENDNKIWIDTNDEIEKSVTSEPDVLASIQTAIYTLQRQMASLMKIRTSGVISGSVTDGTLTELGNSSDPLIPSVIEEDYQQAIEDGDVDPTKDSDFPSYATEAEPTVNHIAIKMGTYTQIQNSKRFFVNGELVWCTDRNNMYLFNNGIFYLVAGSGSSTPIDEDTMDTTELQQYLDNLSSISFVPLNDKDSSYTVRVNEYGNLIVYDKNNDVAQSTPTQDGIMFNNGTLGSIIINSFYLGGLDTDEHSYQPCSHNYVELSNISYQDVNLNGLVLMYTYDNSRWYKLPLWGVCKAQSTFLIRGAQCSVLDVNTTLIKVKSFDMEWKVNGELIKFDRSSQTAAFYICWYNQQTGEIYTRDLTGGNSHPTKEYPESLPDIIDRDGGFVARGYVDLVGVGNSQFFENKSYVPQGGITTNTLFKRTYTLDPVSQSNAKGVAKRNSVKYWKHIDMSKDLFDNIPDYTPKASYENKNASFDKHNFVEDTPNTLTCSFGINATDNTANGGSGATRCFNWNSVGYYDEYLWYKKKTSSTWNRVESYKDGVDYTSATGLNRDTDPDCIKRGLYGYYTRIRWETYYGAAITTHKVMIAGLTAGVYEYKVGRADVDGNSTSYVSKTREFTVRSYNDARTFDFIQTTDQQGANWEEYQIWDLSADYINRNERINQTPRVADSDPTPGVNNKDFDFTINTGDITYNGSRPNEWIDYYNGYSYIDDKEEMLTLGNNDLAPVPEDITGVSNPELFGMTLLGDGNEIPYKVNHVVADLFYTQEMDYNNPPIFTGTSILSEASKTYKVPSLYSFNYGPYHFVSLNSEIRTNSDSEDNTTVRGEFGVEDVVVGDRKMEIYDKVEDWLVRDLLIWKTGSVPQNYTRYSPQDCQKAFIYCHEMPFTITAQNTYYDSEKVGSGFLDPERTGEIWREKSKANLNLKHNFEFQRLFKIWGIRLVFGGHKHTCSISYPIYDAPANYIPYSSTNTDLMGDMIGDDTFNPIIQVVRTSNEEKHGAQAKLNYIQTNFLTHKGRIFNSTDVPVAVGEKVYNAKSTEESSVQHPILRVEIVDNVSAPTYVMCQATGFKNLSNSDTSATDEYCQWLRDFVPLGGVAQWYPFYTRFKVSENKIDVSMERVAGLYAPSSKAGYWEVNRDMPNGHEAKMNELYRLHWADCEIPLN